MIQEFLPEVICYISYVFPSDGQENRTFLKKSIVPEVKELAWNRNQHEWMKGKVVSQGPVGGKSVHLHSAGSCCLCPVNSAVWKELLFHEMLHVLALSLWYFYCFCVTNTSGSQTVLGIRVICTYFLKYRCLIFIFGLQNQNSNDCPVVILKQAGGCWFKGGPGGFDTLLKDQRLSKKGFKFESSIFSHGMLEMNWNPQPQFPYLYVGANKPAEGADMWINYNLCTSYLNPVYKVETVTITIILMYSEIF